MSDKKIETGKPAKKFNLAKRTRIGTYTFTISLILLAVLVTVNLLVAAIPKSLTVFDTSANKLYTISESSEDYVGAVNEDVTFNWICPNGVEDPMLKIFLEKYTGLNSHMKLNILDPIKDPTVLNKYISNTDTQPTEYSLVIESAKRFEIVDYNSLFYYFNQYLSDNYGLTDPVPYEFYAYYNQYYAQAEYYGYTTETYFYGDDTITKAVEYVTLEKIPHVYIVEGHGEAAFSDSLLQLISNNNIEYETLNTITSSSVPDDASCIVIYAPRTDISSTEAQMIGSYLEAGGNMLLITSDDNTGMQNILSLVEPYGVSAVPGMVYDENTSYYKTTQYNLVPDVNTSHNVTSPAASSYTMIMPEAHGIKIAENTGSATVSELFTTSESAYSMVGDMKSDAGSLALGVAIENETEGGATRIVWYSSSDAFTDETAASVSYGNYYYFFYTLFWMNETYISALSDVVGVPTTEPLLDGLTATSTIVWTVIFAAVIPLTVIIWGLVIWLRRRAR